MPDVQPLVAERRVRSKKGGAKNATHASIKNEARDWTIKSLSPETVEVSREAARKSGMKINAWVSKALESAATEPVVVTRGNRVSDDAEIMKLEQSILKEISDLKAQNESLVQIVNSISSTLLKMYDKID